MARSKTTKSSRSKRRRRARRVAVSRRAFRREGVRRMLATVFEDIHAARLDAM
jgi:hypothetical protein